MVERASFHKKEEYLKKIETERPNLHLYSIFQVYEVHPRNRVSLQFSPLVFLLKKPGRSRFTSTWNML